MLQRPWWRSVLAWFAPIGRMALTSYLVQSLLRRAFLRRGLLGKLTSAEPIVIAIVVYAIQVVLCDRWLRR